MENSANPNYVRRNIITKGAIAVSETDEVICMSGQGKTLRVSAAMISKQGRASSGTRIINIDEPDYVVGFDKVANEDEKDKE